MKGLLLKKNPQLILIHLYTYEYKRHRPAPHPWAAPLVPFLAAPRVGRAAVWASVPFGTYRVAGSSQMG